MIIGTKVRLTEYAKLNCNEHTKDHMIEFGDCIGFIVEKKPEYQDWHEVEVQWQPSNLKYLYDINELEEVK